MAPPSRIAPPGWRVRWLARRPPETLPERADPPPPPRPTPTYQHPPRWGLQQDFTPAPPERATVAQRAAAGLPALLRGAAIVLLLAAIAEALAYLLLVINRSGPVSVYLAFAADATVFALGWLAVVVVAVVFVAMALWLQHRRGLAYGLLGTREPRPRWQLWLYCLVPVVNLVAAPVLALELVRAQRREGDLTPDRRLLFIRQWWVAWVVLAMVTVGCVAYARADGGLQHHADAIVYTTLTYLLAAAFVEVTRRLVRAINAGPGAETTTAEESRWLAV